MLSFNFILGVNHIKPIIIEYHTPKQRNTGVLPRVVIKSWGRGFSLATKRVAPGYFYWKIEEK